jgi:hypothetical protein
VPGIASKESFQRVIKAILIATSSIFEKQSH